ncbi:hypothetical protein [Algoriphagus machipongonensis]|uniref:Lipoprotein n=1 Tax=Algoriphagus machipongonensis TaxID=388413 RepID=A3HTW6_9BACT|nr:hypothetical protein [Algoriphagus machipongonensis]EAZ81588.2 hypothetical protein ALPR1_00065 [Algoriphagus machipongonensis]
MKYTLKNVTFLMLAMLAVIGFSCSSDDNDKDPVEADTSIVVDVSEVNQKFEDLDNLTLAILENSGLGARKTTSFSGDFCATTEFDYQDDQKTIIVDFGDGCVSPNGISRKGKIKLVYSGSLLIPGATIVTTFEGYEVNGYKVEGTRTLTNVGLNIITQTVTIAVKVENGKITWPDGGVVSINSDQERVIVLEDTGYDATISGTLSGTSKDGSPFSATITDNLKITQSCVESGVYNPISGLIDFTYKNVKMTLDYGTGDCDKKATVTYPGGVKEINFD